MLRLSGLIPRDSPILAIALPRELLSAFILKHESAEQSTSSSTFVFTSSMYYQNTQYTILMETLFASLTL